MECFIAVPCRSETAKHAELMLKQILLKIVHPINIKVYDFRKPDNDRHVE